MQGAQRYLVFAYLLAGYLLWETLTRIFTSLAYATGVPDPALLGSHFTLARLLGLGLAIGGGVWTWRNEAAQEFSLDVVNELKKVTWPSRKETQTATVVVIVATILCSVILGVFDAAWSFLTGLIYS